MSNRMWTRALATAGALAVLPLAGPAVTAHAVAPAPAAQAAGRGHDVPNPAIPEKYRTQKLDWKPCSFDAAVKAKNPALNDSLCAMMTVPMDWHHPEAHPDIQVAISRTRASGSSQGILTAQVGPGKDGLSLPQEFSARKPQLAADYDLMGMDLRGTGASSHAPCMTTQREWASLPKVPDTTRVNDATFASQAALMKLISESCTKDEMSPFVSTQQAVYDMDLMRELAGVDKLNLVGEVQGSMIGAWYADTYPERVGRFLLDSNMSWSGGFSRYADGVAPATQRRRDEVFFPWVARHHTEYGLGTTRFEVARNYDRIFDALVKRVADGHMELTPQDMAFHVVDDIRGDATLPAAAGYLASVKKFVEDPTLPVPSARNSARTERSALAARVTDLSQQVAARTRSAAAPDASLDLDAGDFGYLCNDSAWSSDLGALKRRWRMDSALYPFSGWSIPVTPCAFWPNAGHAKRTIDLAGAPRILMVQTEGDSLSWYPFALENHLRTRKHTRLVSVDDEGEIGIWGRKPATCVDRIGDAYMFAGIMPSRDTVCGTSPLPKDTKVYPFAGGVTGGRHETTQAG